MHQPHVLLQSPRRAVLVVALLAPVDVNRTVRSVVVHHHHVVEEVTALVCAKAAAGLGACVHATRAHIAVRGLHVLHDVRRRLIAVFTLHRPRLELEPEMRSHI